MDVKFIEFQKIPRLSRDIVITEKIDGTNGVINIEQDGTFLVGSRNRWITPDNDNYGFAKWAYMHKPELMELGPGAHHGEWWGLGIQRNYGLKEKRFSLFNTHVWTEDTKPACCSVVPVLFSGTFDTSQIRVTLSMLELGGSVASPGFMKPEGIVIYHTAGGYYFKKTIEGDESYKGKTEGGQNV